MNSVFNFLWKRPLNLFKKKPTVSFCITCRNRLWQLKETLPKNLKDNIGQKDRVEFVLVDFASTDGLQEWIRDNFVEELKSGYLKYYYSDEMPQWHMSVAKNTAHKFAGGEIVVNLDADNFTGPEGGDYVSRKMRIYGPDKVILHMWTGIYLDGTFGRLVLSKKNFMKFGGYDEKFEVSSYQDTDLRNRVRAGGVKRIRCKNKKYISAIANEKGDGVACDTDRWLAMNWRNKALSIKNIEGGRLVANEGMDIGVNAVRMFYK